MEKNDNTPTQEAAAPPEVPAPPPRAEAPRPEPSRHTQVDLPHVPAEELAATLAEATMRAKLAAARLEQATDDAKAVQEEEPGVLGNLLSGLAWGLGMAAASWALTQLLSTLMPAPKEPQWLRREDTAEDKP